ncbi:MAG: hypothetical protein SGPRY_003590, partial [Prymnesium sp.]
MEEESRRCWGGALRGDWTTCDQGFTRVHGSRQSKTVLRDKFCTWCKLNGTMIPLDRIGTIPSDAEKLIKNSRSGG